MPQINLSEPEEVRGETMVTAETTSIDPSYTVSIPSLSSLESVVTERTSLGPGEAEYEMIQAAMEDEGIDRVRLQGSSDLDERTDIHGEEWGVEREEDAPDPEPAPYRTWSDDKLDELGLSVSDDERELDDSSDEEEETNGTTDSSETDDSSKTDDSSSEEDGAVDLDDWAHEWQDQADGGGDPAAPVTLPEVTMPAMGGGDDSPNLALVALAVGLVAIVMGATS